MVKSKPNWFRENVCEMLREQFEFRELLIQMTRRDLLLRYKQAVMGFGWAVCTPLLNMIVFSVIFTRVAPLQTDIPYPIYAYTGLLPWNFFASSLRFSAISLTSNATLVTKVYFPREIFPFSAILLALVDFAVGSSVLIALMLYYQVGVTRAILFLPLVLMVQVLFTGGMALLLAMGNLFFRDVKYLYELGISIWMFATSVIYPVERIQGRIGTVLKLNPMSPIIDAYRAVLLRGELPGAYTFIMVALISIILFATAWIVFHRAEFYFAENI
jgi:homopolymeric O-antigen transport system permease protein